MVDQSKFPGLLKHSRALCVAKHNELVVENDIWGGEAAGFEPQSFHDGLLELMSLGSISEVAVHKATSGAISSVKRCAFSRLHTTSSSILVWRYLCK